MFSSFTRSFGFGRRRRILPPQAAVVADYRSLLSAGGQSAYDSAAEGDFFYVGAEDYAAVFSAIDGAFTVGMTDSQLVDAPQSTFTRNLGTTLPEAAVTVAAGTLLFGFISQHQAGFSMQHQPRYSNTFKGTYTAIANAPTVLGNNGLSHHLRKPGYSAAASTAYVALFPASSGGGAWVTHGTTNTFVGGGYSSNGSSWTTWNNALPIFQMAGVAE
jgi:hypothetical protein